MDEQLCLYKYEDHFIFNFVNEKKHVLYEYHCVFVPTLKKCICVQIYVVCVSCAAPQETVRISLHRLRPAPLPILWEHGEYPGTTENTQPKRVQKTFAKGSCSAVLQVDFCVSFKWFGSVMRLCVYFARVSLYLCVFVRCAHVDVCAGCMCEYLYSVHV